MRVGSARARRAVGRIARQAAAGASSKDAHFKGTLIITGFIASNRSGVQTTLGRNGSDFSGSIFGSLLDASEIHIWTDVDGVLSADPRRVPDAKVIDSLSYNEAMELAYFGAKVIHPQTMAPAVGRGIPIWIRNTFAPQKQGSLICAKPNSKLPVKGITSIENIAMVNVEGAGMIGVPGTAHRLFGALREEGISVILISQGSSEHSICCAIPGVEAERAARVVAAAFDREIKEGQIQSIQVDTDLAILAVVGDGMAGLARRLGQGVQRAGFRGRERACHRAGRFGAQHLGGGGRQGRHARAARRACGLLSVAAHHLRRTRSARARSAARCSSRSPRRARACATNSSWTCGCAASWAARRCCWPSRAFAIEGWKAALEASPTAADIGKFVEHLHVDHLPHTVIIDCTADESVAKHYAEWLERRHPRGHAEQEGEQRPAELLRIAQGSAPRWAAPLIYMKPPWARACPSSRRCATCARPATRSRVSKASSPARWPICSTCTTARRRSREIVKDAKAKGYTEPDPRDDLSGTDFVRKVIILGREMGLKLEMKDVQVESLIPAGLEKGTIDDFLNGLSKYDGEMKKRFDAGGCARQGVALRGPPHRGRQGRRSASPSSTSRMRSRTSRSPTTWFATPLRDTTPIR